jgi:hypothetical protein
MQAEDLVSCAERHNNSSVTKAGEQTHNLGGVLGLVWGSDLFIYPRGLTASDAEDVEIPSDHRVIQITLPGGLGARYGSPDHYKIEHIQKDSFTRAVSSALPASHQQVYNMQTHATTL